MLGTARSIRRSMPRRRPTFRSRSTRSTSRCKRPWRGATSSGPAPWPAGSSRSTRPTPRGWARIPSTSSAAKTSRRGRPSPSTSTAACSPGTSRATCSTSTSRQHPADEATATAAYNEKTQEPAVCLEPTQISYYRYEDEVPNGCGDGFPKGNKIVDMGRDDDQHQRHGEPDGHRAGGPAVLGRSRRVGEDFQRRADYLHRLHRARHGLGGEGVQATHRRAAAGGRADRPVHGHDPDLRLRDGRADRRQQAALVHHGPGLERRSLRHLRVERRPGHRGNPQVPDPATTRTWTWDDAIVQSRPREAPAVPGQLPALGAEEHDPGLAGDRLPGPLCPVDQQRRVLPEVPARGADAGRHDHGQRHRRREGHRGGVDRARKTS